MNPKIAGFTLIETIIVIAIMIIISTVLLSASKTNNLQIVLSTNQATVVGALNRAKSLALAKWDPSRSTTLSACAFGIHFDVARNLFIIYQDLPVVPGDCKNAGHSYGYIPDKNEEVQTFNLDPRLEILGSTTPVDIVFIAPYLKTSGAGTVTLGIKGTSQTAAVQVTAGGSITSL